MSRLHVPTLEESLDASKPSLAAVEKQLGIVPNLFRLIGSSPAALSGFLAFSGALGQALDGRTRERIALAVAQAYGCYYCLSAHNYLALNVAGISPDEVARNRAGSSSDPAADAVVRFAKKIVETHGHLSDDDVATVKAAGFNEGQVVEIVALVAINCFTNFLNEVAKTDIDFPVVDAAKAA